MTTTAGLPASTYNVQYQLCDLLTPTDCALGNITVQVVTVVANPETGNASAGVASTPIANVAANDFIGSTPATLGATGNASVAQLGTWPAGVTLNTGTGAVVTSTAVGVGNYSIAYTLCDLNPIPDCSSATDTLNVTAGAVVANPDSGTADLGTGSQPIANVAANDFVAGAPAVLGSSGNATVAKFATWPSTITLNPTTGTVATSSSLGLGTYPVVYTLCDKLTPQNCTNGNITVTVVNPPVFVLNPESGTADVGVASTPIANVASNDTINGVTAILGTGGNAKVTKCNTWPTGIALSALGAVTTTASLPATTYSSLQYKLCDLNTPAVCATPCASDTVTVITPSIVANPDAGTADSGIASQPIANVTSNDTINGAPAVVGTGANATISKVGTWPNGLGLNPTTGAVSTQISSANGNYIVQYNLCDLNGVCATTPGTVTVTIITASILANPVNGVGVSGRGSIPIANVLATTSPDTVNGIQATVGSGGNAKLTLVGTWPAGFVLNSQTGSISMSASVVTGSYEMQYLLCDLNVPANCAAGDIEIDVTSAVVANPDTGTAVAGKAQTPIHNVAVNDTVNGVTARLQTSPNATVAAVGNWPTGIALNTTTGAITTAATVAPGLYDQLQYTLCAISGSPCSSATDAVTVAAAVVALPNAGSAVVGQPGTAISNLVAHDTINGVLVTLGSSGNGTVAPVGTWTGIALNPSTGAVTTTSAALAGNYLLTYQLCDKSTPTPNCSTALVDISITQPFTEVSMSSYATGDIEFDWARDGLLCSSCNFGSTNSQVNWTDRNNNLWVSGINAATGAFTPISARGNGTPVDTTAFFWQDWGNGPEWGFSTPTDGSSGGYPISQLVYTRYQPSMPATWQYAGAALATQVGPSSSANPWSVAFFPGAYTSISDNTVLPEASQCPSDPIANAVFENLLPTTQMFTEPLSTAPGTAPTLTPFGAQANGIGERFVPCAHDAGSSVGGTRWLTFQGNVTIGTNNLQQVFWYDMDTKMAQQITFDPTTKQRAVMFKAPDIGFRDSNGNAQYILMTLAAENSIQVYVQQGFSSNGAPNMVLVNTIYSPDAAETYMFDPKAFIHCSADYPLCRTYVVVGLSASPNSQQTESVPNGMAVTALDPKNPMFKILVTAQSQPGLQRLDPKYFITSGGGPLLYYDQLIALTNTQPYQDNGIFTINLQLGTPSGPCVGSSAQKG